MPPPNDFSTSFTDIVITDNGGRTTTNTFQDYTISSLDFRGSVDNNFVINVFRSASFVRNLIFDRGGNSAQIRVNPGASGNIFINDAGTAGSIILNDHLDLIHDGSGTLTFDIAITEEASSSHGITSSGSGPLVIQGENTYTGDTTVLAGVLTMDAGSSLTFTPTTNGASNKITGVTSGTGTIHLEGEINIDLDSANSTPGNSWLLVDSSSLNVTYNSASFTVNSSKGSFIKNEEIWEMNDGGNQWIFNQSTGILSLAENEYAIWTETSFDRPFTNSDPDADFDNDGLSNLLEFVLGGDPTISQLGIAPTTLVEDSNLKIVFRRSDASKQSPAIELLIEVSNDLNFTTPINDIIIGNTDDLGPIGSLGASYTVINNDGFDTVTVTIPISVTNKNFARLKATLP